MPLVALKAFTPVCDGCGKVGEQIVMDKKDKGIPSLPANWQRVGRLVKLRGIGSVLQEIELMCDTCSTKREQKESAIEFANNVKSLAALGDGFEEVTPWTPSSQVVNMVCNRLAQLAKTVDLSEGERQLAESAAGAVHAVCVVLGELEESWYERHSPASHEGEGSS